MAGEQTKDRLVSAVTAELTPPLLELGLDLEALEITPAGRRRVLRIAVDKDGGVTMDEVAEATKEVSRVLDGSDVMGEQPYTLEVTSPGIDRPLTLPRHWRRNRSRLVTVSTGAGETLRGRILDNDDDTVRLDIDGATRELALGEVVKAHVEVEFNRKES